MVYVFYRTPNPDNATVAEVEMILQQNNIDINQLVEWTTNYCEEVDEIAPLYAAARQLLSPLNPLGK
jgi:hypothetical protein